MTIAKSEPRDFDQIHEIINDGALAYKGIIPADRWHEPYMSEEDLEQQLGEGVEFYYYSVDSRILGVMGIQFKGDVTLIRHAYVRTSERGKGIGGLLLTHLRTLSTTPILIGTWADATWAIAFYQKHQFRVLSESEKNTLLRTYWSVPVRQMDTSVVLASAEWVSQE